MEEYMAALSTTKKGAPGTDRVNMPMLRAATEEVHQCILACMNKVLTPGAEIPEAWHKARIVLIPKDGSPANPANFQPISLLQVSYKLFTKIITNQLSIVTNEYILSSSQLGFQPGMSSQSALHVMVDIIEDATRCNNEIHVAYVDFKKAFDLVRHAALLNTLAHYGLRESFIDLVSRLYSDCASDIYLNSNPSEPFPIHRGVRQGNTLSPLLFILAINPMLEWIHSSSEGYQFSNSLKVLTATYCNDVTLVANKPEDLKSMTHQLMLFGAWAGLEVNPSKSAHTCARASQPAMLRMPDRADVSGSAIIPSIPQSACYHYMGVALNLDLDWSSQMASTKSRCPIPAPHCAQAHIHRKQGLH